MEDESFDFLLNLENRVDESRITSLLSTFEDDEQAPVKICTKLIERIAILPSKTKNLMIIIRDNFPAHPKLLFRLIEIIKVLDDPKNQIDLLDLIPRLFSNTIEEMDHIYSEMTELMLTDRHLCVSVFNLFSTLSPHLRNNQNLKLQEMCLSAISWVDVDDLPVIVCHLLRSASWMKDKKQAEKVIGSFRKIFRSHVVSEEEEDDDDDEDEEMFGPIDGIISTRTGDEEEISSSDSEEDELSDDEEDEDDEDDDYSYMMVNDSNVHIIKLLVEEVFILQFRINPRLVNLFLQSFERSKEISHFDFLLFLVLMKTSDKAQFSRRRGSRQVIIFSLFQKLVKKSNNGENPEFITFSKIKQTFELYCDILCEVLFGPVCIFISFLYQEKEFENWCYGLFPHFFLNYSQLRSEILSLILNSMMMSEDYEIMGTRILRSIVSELRESRMLSVLSDYSQLFEESLSRPGRYREMIVVRTLLTCLTQGGECDEMSRNALLSSLSIYLRKKLYSVNDKECTVGYLTLSLLLHPSYKKFLQVESTRNRFMEWMLDVNSLSVSFFTSTISTEDNPVEQYKLFIRSPSSKLSLHTVIMETLYNIFDGLSISDLWRIYDGYFSKFNFLSSLIGKERGGDILFSKFVTQVDMSRHRRKTRRITTVSQSRRKNNNNNKKKIKCFLFNKDVEDEDISFVNLLALFKFFWMYYRLYFKFSQQFHKIQQKEVIMVDEEEEEEEEEDEEEEEEIQQQQKKGNDIIKCIRKIRMERIDDVMKYGYYFDFYVGKKIDITNWKSKIYCCLLTYSLAVTFHNCYFDKYKYYDRKRENKEEEEEEEMKEKKVDLSVDVLKNIFLIEFLKHRIDDNFGHVLISKIFEFFETSLSDLTRILRLYIKKRSSSEFNYFLKNKLLSQSLNGIEDTWKRKSLRGSRMDSEKDYLETLIFRNIKRKYVLETREKNRILADSIFPFAIASTNNWRDRKLRNYKKKKKNKSSIGIGKRMLIDRRYFDYTRQEKEWIVSNDSNEEKEENENNNNNNKSKMVRFHDLSNLLEMNPPKYIEKDYLGYCYLLLKGKLFASYCPLYDLQLLDRLQTYLNDRIHKKKKKKITTTTSTSMKKNKDRKMQEKMKWNRLTQKRNF